MRAHTRIDRIIDVGYLILDCKDVHIVVGVLTSCMIPKSLMNSRAVGRYVISFYLLLLDFCQLIVTVSDSLSSFVNPHRLERSHPVA